MMRTLKQRGDTLVEVIICIGIVSLILTGAYVTTNRSTLGIRDAQEHAEALKLAQGQLEQIRQNAATATPGVFTQTGTFCMVNAAVVTTAAQCRQDNTGAQTTEEPVYTLSATRADCTVGANCHAFTIKVEWTSISNKAKAQEQIVYRLHE